MELFSLKNKYALDSPIHEIALSKYSLSSLATANSTKSNIFPSFQRQDAHICLQNSFISTEFEVLKQDTTRYVDNNQINLVNFEPIAFFSEAELVTSSGKLLDKVDILQAVCLMYSLLTWTQQTSKLMDLKIF